MSHCVAFTNAMKETNEGDLTNGRDDKKDVVENFALQMLDNCFIKKVYMIRPYLLISLVDRLSKIGFVSVA